MDQILYGAAYYDEYMKEERLEKDMQMIKDAGMNVIRIAESTWSSEEPEDGVFDFHHVTRAIEAAAKYGLKVIVGTPTYAIPPWLAAKDPSVIATTERGPGKYGARQNMDITHPLYLYHAERIIRKLMEAVSHYDNVIGYQLDNETKHYNTAGPGVQKRFVEHLKKTFGTVEAMNFEFGFNYWSNRVDTFDHVPDVTGTINGSFFAEFEKFRRELVTEFLCWQRKIVDEYRREDQFVTQNFDFEWRNFSFGVQPDVNHFHAAKAVTLAGCDIYHPTQDLLTGKEAAFCGAITRALKKSNYIVLETEAQGHIGWTPYNGQLRMQAFSHTANGADGVMYWHWHSIHNSFETYWRGLLSHDMEKNRLYQEASTIGADLNRLSEKLVHLTKQNKVAILVSNESLTALSRMPMFPLPDFQTKYNDVVRRYADALYEMNLEYDIISPEEEALSDYGLIIVPVLYSAEDALLLRLKEYTAQGGTLLATFKSGYSNEYLTASQDTKPHLLSDCFGMSYQEFTIPRGIHLELSDKLAADGLTEQDLQPEVWMEFLMPQGAQVLASYREQYFGDYAAITENSFGKGKAIYAGCHISPALTAALLRYAAEEAGVTGVEQQAAFPVNIKNGINQAGRRIHYYFNYSGSALTQKYLHGDAVELLSGRSVSRGSLLQMKPWDVLIMEENT